jgi:NADH-quinone oxidoreductase subunit A
MEHSVLLAEGLSDPRSNWVPILLLGLIGLAFAGGNVLLSSLLGPSRRGKVKDQTYESGMMPIDDARKRFNVRFYLVAIMFVAFDVEIVIMYPWAASFARVIDLDPALGQTMFIGIGLFITLVLVGYLYDISRGVLKWD